MQDSAKKYLFDIQAACRLIQQFTQGKTLEIYQADPLLRSGVERQFITIGEALNQLLRLEPGLSGSITAHRRIIAFRNYLIHGYPDISDDIVWGIIETNFPTLQEEVNRLLEQA